MNLLSVKDLTVDFITPDSNFRAVNKVSFDIPKGKTIGLVGESGSGKSVTSMAIMRLLAEPPAHISGKVLFNGENILDYSASQMRGIRGNDISMIFQEPMTSLNPVFRVGDQIAESLRLHKGMNKKEALEKAIDLMNQVGIPNPTIRYKSYPHELSGGQKQRIMIAMAIACEPKLLICDEPTTALDVTIQKQVLELMFDLQQKYGMGMLFITHDLGVIADIADEVVVMYRSNIMERGDTKKIFTMPKHPYTRGLMSCKPGLEVNPKRLLTVSDFMDEAGVAKTVPEERKKPFEKKYSYSDQDNPVLLKVENLKTYFPIKGGLFGKTIDHVKAVDDISFQLRKGKTLGLVGESGCGKTTLGRSILRLIEPTSGKVTYDGIDLTSLNPKELKEMRRRVQIIFQDPYSSLNPRMTISNILIEPMKLHGIGESKAERLSMAADLMKKVDLEPEHLGRYPHEFSGGQRQRICIARALAMKPEFIICDESVSALDVSVQAQVLNLLLDLQEELDLTYILISHDLSVINFFCDMVGVMNKGKLVEMGPSEKVYFDPQEAYTKKLLSAIPKGIPKELLDQSQI